MSEGSAKMQDSWAGMVTFNISHFSCNSCTRCQMAKIGKPKGPKPSRKCSGPLDWNVLSDVQKFDPVFTISKSVTGGGADGSVLGVNGSVNTVSTKLILDSFRVKGEVVCVLGAADGKFMICAVVAGAMELNLPKTKATR